MDAVRGVTFEDAKAILTGGDSAATEMLRSTTEGRLTEVFEPIIAAKMEENPEDLTGAGIMIGTPEYMKTAVVGGQLARRLGLPPVLEVSQQVEGALQLRSIEHRSAQPGSRWHDHLVDVLETLAEAVGQPSPDPDAEASGVRDAVALLVLDGTAGQNGLAQAEAFGEVADLTGVVLTKMDGSARGGVAFALELYEQLRIRNPDRSFLFSPYALSAALAQAAAGARGLP